MRYVLALTIEAISFFLFQKKDLVESVLKRPPIYKMPLPKGWLYH
jgi:hypothetical protein